MNQADEALRVPLAAATRVGLAPASGDSNKVAAANPPRMLPFNSVFGNVVANHRGEALGTLSDVLLDLPQGRIAYAIVSSGGFMGKGERLSAVPWSRLSRDTDRHCFILAVEKTRFDAAPAFDNGRWPSIFDWQWHVRIHEHYDSKPYWLLPS